MIDPFDITDFRRTDAELEELWVFCVCVAGKKATMISRMVEEFLEGCGHEGSPFQRIRAMIAEGSLGDHLRRARLGKYALLERHFEELLSRADLDLRQSPPQAFETLPGVGHKTSRFFILHSRPGARVGVIDTHMLKFLRDIGIEDVPETIPTGERYLRLEAIVLEEARKRSLAFADFDLRIWSWYASGNRSAPTDEALSAPAALARP